MADPDVINMLNSFVEEQRKYSVRCRKYLADLGTLDRTMRWDPRNTVARVPDSLPAVLTRLAAVTANQEPVKIDLAFNCPIDQSTARRFLEALKDEPDFFVTFILGDSKKAKGGTSQGVTYRSLEAFMIYKTEIGADLDPSSVKVLPAVYFEWDQADNAWATIDISDVV